MLAFLQTREPAVIAGMVRAILFAGVAFGLKLTIEQIGAVMLALEAILTVFVRQTVTANKNITDPKP